MLSRKFKTLVGNLLCVAVVAGWSSPALAKIQGTVLDRQGRPLEGVEVKVENSGFRVATGAAGGFSLNYVPGEFRVMFSRAGFFPQAIPLKLSAVAD